ncbi:MAG: FecR domain-containing protein [Longimicrobiales bacterium]
MDELILRHLQGETSDIEARSLERWRAHAPENERHYQSVRRVWGLTVPEPGASVPPPALDAVIAEAEARRRQDRGRSQRRAVLRSPWTGYTLAAAAVAALALFATTDRGAAPAPPALVPVESASGAGDVMTMALSDGSVVRLARASSVEFPPDDGVRRVRLDGRAFFAVAEGEMPFVVSTRDAEVRVHGTRFEVRQDGEGLRVVVVEGRVGVESSAGRVDLGPGEVAWVAGRQAPRVMTADPWALLEWDVGLLVFQETPLADVAREVERHFGRPVRLADPSLGPRRITAWFDDEPLEEVVGAVCLVAGVRCTVDVDGVAVGR